MAVPFSNTKLRVPKGFQNILEAFAREVLRSQPENIHEFAAAYFENMMKVRVETGHDPAVHGAKLDDRNYNNDGFKKKPSTITEQQQNNAAVAIQTQYRQHEAKAEVEELRREQAAIKIQSGFRGHVDREQVRKMRDKRHHKKVEEEIDIDLNDPDVQKAAAFIQSGFKGFKVRKQVVEDDKKSTSIKEANAHHHAATKIQAHYRGHLIRKHMQKADNEQAGDTVDLQDPRYNSAAVKIQSHYRGHLVRKTSKQKSGISPATDKAASRAGSGHKGSKEQQVKESSNENDEKDISNNRISVDQADQDAGEVEVDQMLFDDDTSHAAVKIQAGFRGYKVRKQLKGGRVGETENPEDDELEDLQDDKELTVDEADVGDIDLSNPEAEQAAIKIQAGFKGFKVRKELHEKHARGTFEEETPRDQEDDAEVGGVAPQLDLDDPDMEMAAVKIQAGFKGMKARREVKAMLSERSHGDTRDLEEVSEREMQEEDEQTDDRTQEVDDAEGGETDDQVAGEPLGDDQVTDEPEAGDRVTDEPTGDDQVTDEPVGDDLVTDEPAGDDQVTDEPAGDDQVTDEPAGDDQVTDEPAGDDQVTDEPVGDDQVTDQPAGDDQVTDEPAADEPATDDQVTEDLESQDLFS